MQEPNEVADNILVHPDVRRMLLEAKVNNEGCRALAAWTGILLDQSHSCLLYTSPSPRDATLSRMPSSA